MADALYTPHPLDGAFERVRRAEEHLIDLRPRIEAMRQQQAHTLLAQFDGRPWDEFLVPNMVQASMRIPVLVGEICYKLRGALDYLMFELAKHDSRVTHKKTQFPIVDRPEDFTSDRTAGYLKGVNRAHVAMIERLQPYNRCDWTKALRDLSNPDKHREFVKMGSTGTALVYSRTDPEYDGLELPVHRTQHPAAAEMDVKVDFTCTVRFGDGTPVVETLELIKMKVSETLTAFKTEFT